MADLVHVPKDYDDYVRDLKARIRDAQLRAALSVNRELVLLYWQIGRDILERQTAQGWGAKVVDRLAEDLRREFPHMKGFSPRNLKYMRAFAEAYPDAQFVQQVAAQIPWFHNCVLLDQVKERFEREWYIRQTIENGWSRNVLIHQVESRLYFRQGKAVTNFSRTLPATKSDLTAQLLKDPYNFDFLGLDREAHERDLERGLLDHIRDFLLEMGAGFAFVGSQYALEVGNRDFFIDLLFYHTRLHCYVVVDLKIGEFQPEYTGKMNFYLSAVDELVKSPEDGPSIGLVLCKSSDRTVAEYALRDVHKPLGISTYQIMEALPQDLRGELPSIEEIEGKLTTDLDWDAFTPKPNDWLERTVEYEGWGRAEFTTLEGTAEGPVKIRFDETGNSSVEMEIGEKGITCKWPLPFGAQQFFSTQSPIHGKEGVFMVQSSPLKFNQCNKLEVTTSQGKFVAAQNISYSYSTPVNHSNDLRARLKFYLPISQFDIVNAELPKYWVLPLSNFISDFFQWHPDLDRHPLRIYPTPIIPEGLSEQDEPWAKFKANSKNRLILFEFGGGIGFIEALPDYEESKNELREGRRHSARTAVMIGHLGNNPIDFPSDTNEASRWFPFNLLNLLGLATGTQVGAPWVEFRDRYGNLVRRFHLKMGNPRFSKGHVAIEEGSHIGIGYLISKAQFCPDLGKSYLYVALKHLIRSWEGGLEEMMVFLFRAFQCLQVRYHLQSQVAEPLTAKQRQALKKTIDGALKKAQTILAENAAYKNLFAEAMESVLTETERNPPFSDFLTMLLKRFDLPDAEIVDAYYRSHPRPDGLAWAQAAAKYLQVPLEEGYFNISGAKYDSEDVIRYFRHLHDILLRLVFKILGYDGDYNPTVTFAMEARTVDWVKADTAANELGYGNGK